MGYNKYIFYFYINTRSETSYYFTFFALLPKFIYGI